jgi:hypothetical protein
MRGAMQIPPHSSLLDALSRVDAGARVQRFADRLAEVGVAAAAPGVPGGPAAVAPPAPGAATEPPRRRGSLVDLVV